MRAARAKWAKAHPEVLKGAIARWREQNVEKRREYARRYYVRHRDRVLAARRARRARRRTA
jgi:hypothetical protein